MLQIIPQPFLGQKVILICFLVLLGMYPPSIKADNGKVKIIFFSSRTCSECQWVKNEFLPKIFKKYQNRLEMKTFEITSVDNFMLLINLEKSCGRKINKTPPLMIVGEDVLEGDLVIRTDLEQTINKYLKTGGIQWPKLLLN